VGELAAAFGGMPVSREGSNREGVGVASGLDISVPEALMPRFVRNRKDGNHHPIVQALEAAGVKVRDLSEAGGGTSDLLTLFRGELRLIEIKNPEKPTHKPRLTKLQEKFREAWPVHVVTNEQEALAAHGLGEE